MFASELRRDNSRDGKHYRFRLPEQVFCALLFISTFLLNRENNFAITVSGRNHGKVIEGVLPTQFIHRPQNSKRFSYHKEDLPEHNTDKPLRLGGLFFQYIRNMGPRCLVETVSTDKSKGKAGRIGLARSQTWSEYLVVIDITCDDLIHELFSRSLTTTANDEDCIL
jgi:hypothetical protein